MQPRKHTVTLQGPPLVIEAAPLTRDAFAPFGDVVENPRPGLDPLSVDSVPSPTHFAAVKANQGSAIKYADVSHLINLYDQARSGRPGSPAMSLFSCAARVRIPDPHEAESPPALADPARTSTSGPSPGISPLPTTFPIAVLERHPFTTQTFIPLTFDPNAHYLVIVAPTLPATGQDTAEFAVPAQLPSSTSYPRPLPGAGLPDLRKLRAFVARADQAVTYGAGTWHAPMVALGSERGKVVDFVVTQFVNGIAEEDCQEVFFESLENSVEGEAPVVVTLRTLPDGTGKAKL
ncbi:hypothetical protein VTJ04DRAFT_9814 [Mycothermus thermophilus]|uniref:uncharacterized protein n=1 Tax=Humicola insolens TaxID=85995 RepID=UPI003742A42A